MRDRPPLSAGFLAGAGALVCCALLAACAREEKVVRYKPFFANIPEAEHGVEAVNPGGGYRDPTMWSGETVIENPDGSVTLVSRSVLQLMGHIVRTLKDGDDELFIEQVLSTVTKEHFREEGRDIGEAVEHFRAQRPEIELMFTRMPFGEQSPQVTRTKTAKRQWKFELNGSARRNCPLTELWVAMEQGNYKLVWIR